MRLHALVLALRWSQMLTLLLLRHAEAEMSRGDDHSRALTSRGEWDADEIGTFLAAHRLVPDVALVSTARRTSRTFERVAARLGTNSAIHAEKALYNACAAAILARLGQLEAPSRVVIVVGHNPGIMEAAMALAREGDLSEIERLRGRFPPCGLAVVGFEVEDWRDACASGGHLDALVFPEDLASGA